MHEKNLKWTVNIKWINWLGLGSRKIRDPEEHFLKVDRFYLVAFHLQHVNTTCVIFIITFFEKLSYIHLHVWKSNLSPCVNEKELLGLCGALVNDSKTGLFSWSKLLKIKYREADYSKIICDMLLQLFKFDVHAVFLLFF